MLTRHGRRSRFARTLGSIIVLTALAVVASCGNESSSTLTGLTREEPLRSNGVTVTDVTDSGAYPATDASFELVARPGALLVVYFGYTNCPDICPTSLAELRAALRRIGDDAERVDLAMITVDPERDTGEVLNGYVGSFVDRFHVLRPATPDELDTVQAAFLASSSITTTEAGVIEVGHSATAYVVDDEGVVRVEWPFGHGVDNVVNDLEILLKQVAGTK